MPTKYIATAQLQPADIPNFFSMADGNAVPIPSWLLAAKGPSHCEHTSAIRRGS